jgi:tRNA-specific 2-thiouridylase
METPDGTLMGTHDGLPFYTLGQRKGLPTGGGPGEPYYVVAKDPSRNALIIAQGEDHPLLYSTQVTLRQTHFITPPPSYPFRCSARVRYRSPAAPCAVLSPTTILFDTPQKAVTPGQSLVLYNGPLCLGGGIISCSKPNESLI